MDFERYRKAEYNQQYVSGMRPVFNKKALYSDMSEDYISPSQPSAYDVVTIRFRTAVNNVDRVIWVSGSQKVVMNLADSDDLFDYYEYRVQLENEELSYYFEVHVGKACCLYDGRGTVKDVNPYYHFRLIPGFATPDWAKGAVMYQIYVDRFFNGDPTNDVLTGEYRYIGDITQRVEDWDKYPATMGVREFYGGDLQGVLDKMDYLQDLGIEVIYFNPLFVSPSNHKYDIQDYDHIDPHFGKIVSEQGELLAPEQTENKDASRYINRISNPENLNASNALFAKVVEEAHKRGIRVILDGVFNHCGSFNKWLDREQIYAQAEGYEKGAYISGDSPYRNYFSFSDQGRWPFNPTYDGWWGHDTLPKLNYEGSRELYQYVLEIAKKWVSPPYNADGWRLDVAADLGHSPGFNHQFWKDFRKAVKTANPNAIILAEHYGSPKEWLRGDEWDSVMNYDAFMEPVTWFLTGMQKHSDDFRQDMLGNADSFWGAMTHHFMSFTGPSAYVAMNELSNHDHSRFLTRTNHKVGRTNTLGPEAANEGVNKAVMREAVMIQMTWIGAPTLYYGDEAGVCGFTDPDNRRTYPWGHEDQEMIRFHREMIRIHKKYPELKTGSLKYVDADYNFIAYGRFQREGGHSYILINNNDHEITKDLSVWYLGIPKECTLERIAFTSFEGFRFDSALLPVVAGKAKVTMPAFSGMILRYQDPESETKEAEERKEKGITRKFWF